MKTIRSILTAIATIGVTHTASATDLTQLLSESAIRYKAIQLNHSLR